MAVEYEKGFKIQHVELFLMSSMRKTTTSLAFFETDAGLVLRKNDIPSLQDDSNKNQKVLIGGIENRKGDEGILYELPYFEDNMTNNNTGFTVVRKSELTREHVVTLFDKL